MAKIAVAPLVGAWIEIINVSTRISLSQSLPSWERGLKLHPSYTTVIRVMSLPSWERGLKYLNETEKYLAKRSLPSWERGLKLRNANSPSNICGRSPRGSVD